MTNIWRILNVKEKLLQFQLEFGTVFIDIEEPRPPLPQHIFTTLTIQLRFSKSLRLLIILLLVLDSRKKCVSAERSHNSSCYSA